MKDAADVEPHLWPTNQNIRREMQRLTEDCLARDQFFFLYAGHAGMTAKDSDHDGQHTYIVPCDASDEDGIGFIMNTDLHSYLVKPLKSQCQLVAFLDACHSATLLVPYDNRGFGLRERVGEASPRQHSHARINRRSMPFISYATRERTTNSFDMSVTDLQLPTHFDDGIDDAGDCCPRQIISAVKESFVRPWHLCQEFCRCLYKACDPYILCVSACKGDESTLEMHNLSMTKTLVRVLERDPNPSLASFILRARVSRQEFMEEYESRKRAYAVKRMRKNHRRGSRNDSTLRSAPGECSSTPLTQAEGSPEPHTILWPPLGEIQMSSNQATRSVTERFVI
ncbi:hypothetical protein K523DRAFT_345785 [Schizophyllum commune Tattone D]|nr:hypothetical protein K523DRAFT_345785 [Schizophyllum commune Tattone D]